MTITGNKLRKLMYMEIPPPQGPLSKAVIWQCAKEEIEIDNKYVPEFNLIKKHKLRY